MAASTKFRSSVGHKRHHSWPPLQLRPSHLDHHHTYARRTPSDSIDDDPFAFFLSSKDDKDEEEEGYISDWMNARYNDTPRARSESPVGRLPKMQDPGALSPPRDSLRTAISRLAEWLDKMEKMYFSKKPAEPQADERKQKSPEMLPRPLPISPHVRGRKKSRRTSVAMGNRLVRSHSGKPRVWQEPGVSIYPLSEEAELEDVGLGISI